MKFGRSACLAGLVALGAWSVAACSSETKSGNDGGTGGSSEDGGGGKSTGGTAGKGGAGGSTGGTAGKGGSAGKGGTTSTGGTTNSVDGGQDGGVPEVKITTSPVEGQTYSTTKISVAYVVSNFELKPPGTGASCAKDVCGHVHVNVDGNDCNQSATIPYNNAGNTSPLDIDLTLCKGGVNGTHSVVVSLHNDDHSAVTVNNVAVESAPVNFKYAAGDAGTGDAGDAAK